MPSRPLARDAELRHAVEQGGALEAQARRWPCGYCIAGVILAAQAMLVANPHASAREIRAQRAGNVCRCSTQLRILRAITRAQKAIGP